MIKVINNSVKIYMVDKQISIKGNLVDELKTKYYVTIVCICICNLTWLVSMIITIYRLGFIS